MITLALAPHPGVPDGASWAARPRLVGPAVIRGNVPPLPLPFVEFGPFNEQSLSSLLLDNTYPLILYNSITIKEGCLVWNSLSLKHVDG